nr:MAG TPA: hypothetical protein [Caudoviricetes sp.]DAY57267.1 MAG TPA: hypothetical protein [Caudoviricetes sp.]
MTNRVVSIYGLMLIVRLKSCTCGTRKFAV